MSAFGLVVRFTALEGAEGALAAALGEVDAIFQGVAGCQVHLVMRDVADERVFWITEVFDDRGAHAAAMADPRIQALATRIADLLAEAPVRHETMPALRRPARQGQV